MAKVKRGEERATEMGMGLKEWLIPQEKAFFLLLEKESKTVLEGADALLDLLTNYHQLEEERKKIKEIEHAGDDVVHEIYHRLNRTFVTPMDHEDISKLASHYDDVLDLIYAVVNRLYLFKIKEPTPPMVQFAELIVKAVTEIDSAISNIRKVDQEKIDKKCIEVDSLENLADVLLNESVASLFDHYSTIEVIKLKEIYEFLEAITDKCEDVAYVIRDIVIKRA